MALHLWHFSSLHYKPMACSCKCHRSVTMPGMNFGWQQWSDAKVHADRLTHPTVATCRLHLSPLPTLHSAPAPFWWEAPLP
jgi:hypothetical protein